MLEIGPTSVSRRRKETDQTDDWAAGVGFTLRGPWQMLQSSGGIQHKSQRPCLSSLFGLCPSLSWSLDSGSAHGRHVLYHLAPVSLLWILTVEEEEEWLVRIDCVKASGVGCLWSRAGTPNLYCRGPLLSGGSCGASQAGSVPGSPTKPSRHCWVSLPWFLQLC